ncbi:MAG: DUF4411 family protein [Burkholderiales bacterium]|nr:DUF4411 family protein [Burkholderiales bacterium]
MSIVDNPRYLIDSNCLIAAKNTYYNPNFCSQFWNVIRILYEQEILYSIDKVRKELANGDKDDYLRMNIAHNKIFDNMWLKTSLASSGYKKVVQEANTWFERNRNGRQRAFNEFLSEDNADAFLLAIAYENNYTIITQEKADPNNGNKRIKIPDIAEKLNIKCCNTYDMLNKYCDKNFAIIS